MSSSLETRARVNPPGPDDNRQSAITAVDPHPGGPRNLGRFIISRRLLTIAICLLGVLFPLPGAAASRTKTAGRLARASLFLLPIPRYPGARVVPMGKSRVGLNAMSMHYFMTNDLPHRIAAYYEVHFRKAGIFVHGDITHVDGTLWAIDLSHGNAYQLLMRRTNGTTFVLASAGRIPGLDPVRDTPVPLRLFRKSTIVTNSEISSGGNRAHLIMSTNSGSIAENRAHYHSELIRLGYRPKMGRKLRDVKRRDLFVLENARGDEATVALSCERKGRCLVHVTLISPDLGPGSR